MTDESKVNRTHKYITGYMNFDGKYIISFKDCIYNDYKDALELEKIYPKVLNPDGFEDFGGFEDFHGGFIKDNIIVHTFWTGNMGYCWEINSNDELVQKIVYEWAAMVYDEYEKLKDIVEK